MYARNAYKQYKQTQITSANQKTLIVLLYAGAIKFISQAKEKMQKNDLAGKGMAIIKAIDIINELTKSLNQEQGGEVARQLGDLYFHMTQQLTEANIYNKTNPLDHVVTLLTSLKEAWEKLPSAELEQKAG